MLLYLCTSYSLLLVIVQVIITTYLFLLDNVRKSRSFRVDESCPGFHLDESFTSVQPEKHHLLIYAAAFLALSCTICSLENADGKVFING